MAAWYEPVDTPPALDRVLACSWTAHPTGRHRLVPDACIDMLWISTGQLLVCGPEITAWDFELPHGTVSAGVRFRPGVAPGLLGRSAQSMRDVRVPLGELVGADAEHALRSRIEAASHLHGRRRELERFVAATVAGHSDRPTDDFADRVLEALASRPRANAAELADELTMTARQLHRRALFDFGYGPSTLARILRFQRFLALAEVSGRHRHRLAPLAIDAGYSDQAHLARDCRAITGQTPTMFLAHYFPTFPRMSDPYKTQESFAVTMSA